MVREAFNSGGVLNFIEKKHLQNFTNNDVKVFKFAKQIVEQIPLGISKIFPNMNQAFFYENDLKRIQRSDLEGMPTLIALSFYGNLISHIPEDIFFDLKLLKSVSISYNTLQSLPDHIFQNQLDLRRVYLNSNFLIALQPEVFENNDKLEVVFLQNNLLARIAPFGENLPITSIDLRNNYCADHQISHQSEIKNLNDILVNRCKESSKDVTKHVEMCAEELNYCKMEEVAAQNKNKIIKNEKKRALIL